MVSNTKDRIHSHIIKTLASRVRHVEVLSEKRHNHLDKVHEVHQAFDYACQINFSIDLQYALEIRGAPDLWSESSGHGTIGTQLLTTTHSIRNSIATKGLLICTCDFQCKCAPNCRDLWVKVCSLVLLVSNVNVYKAVQDPLGRKLSGPLLRDIDLISRKIFHISLYF